LKLHWLYTGWVIYPRFSALKKSGSIEAEPYFYEWFCKVCPIFRFEKKRLH